VYTYVGTKSVLADEWTHVAAMRNDSTVKILVNSAEEASGTYAGLVKTGTAPVRIGADNAGSYFAGMIDEVRIAAADKTAALGKTTVTYDYNARNQLTKETAGSTDRFYSYDKNGNVTKIEEKVGTTVILEETMTYDKLNRMTGYTGPKGPETSSYRGAEWHRFSNSGKSFVYDGDNVLADIESGVDAFYVTPFLDRNLSMTTDPGGTPTTHYYSQDGLGSVRTLTDSSGIVRNRYDYRPFGKPFAPGTSVTVSQRYTYTGREQNPTSALMYYRYRHYAPRVGRFGGRDPILYDGDKEGNLYAYVGNMPGRYHDPYGKAYGCIGLGAGGTLMIPMIGPFAIGVQAYLSEYMCVGWSAAKGWRCVPCTEAKLTLLAGIGFAIDVGWQLAVMAGFGPQNAPTEGLSYQPGMGVGVTPSLALGVPGPTVGGAVDINLKTGEVSISVPKIGIGASGYWSGRFSFACVGCSWSIRTRYAKILRCMGLARNAANQMTSGAIGKAVAIRESRCFGRMTEDDLPPW